MERYEYSAEKRELLERSLIPFAIYQFIDKRVVTLIVSDGFCKLCDYDNREQAYYDMDHNMYKDTHPDDAARVADAAYIFATEGGRYETIYRTKNKNGNGYRILHAIGEHFLTDTGIQLAQVWYTDEGPYIPGDEAEENVFRRLLNMALHDESLIRASYFDYLTGLPSMTYFFELADSACKSMIDNGGKPVFLFMDLSGMKFFNHKHGFAEGDTLLRSFAGVLMRYFGNENCCRFGQDHFAIYTEESGIEDTLHELFREWQSTNGGKSLPVRVGIYLNHERDADISIACDCAKLACDTLRNTYVSAINYYNKALQDEEDRQHYIVSNLERAISEKWITVYYQPIVRATNGKVCDEEALARWIDPINGFLSPGDFIPILEEAGNIYKLDLYVVDRIIEKIKTIQKAGLSVVPQSVNLSRTDFDACDIVSEICTRMDRAGLSHDLLTIEITESTVGTNFEFMKKQVERLRSLGFQVWMDDFGSGYSSLDVLQSLEFDLIKFDMRFVQQLDEGENGKIILTELMRMATSLGLETVCEGVEKDEHVEFLREIGCCKLQGYYYTKPIPLDMILERYRKGNQIGFEDPGESAYYESIGRINMYDYSTIASDGDTPVQHYFNALPMCILEVGDNRVYITRSNHAFRDFMVKTGGPEEENGGIECGTLPRVVRAALEDCMSKEAQDGKILFINERLPDGSTSHTIFKRVADNPVNGRTAIAFVVISITDKSDEISYSNIARSLAADYFNIFYVNMKTEEFIEYSSEAGEDSLALERRGKRFFETCIADAPKYLYDADVDGFLRSFNKERIGRILDEQGTFTITYRMMKEGMPVYVNMKIMRMNNDNKDDHIVIGVSNVDAQMRQKEVMDRIAKERAMYNRIAAFADNYLCLYSVHPETGHYIEYNSTPEFKSLGFPEEGDHFFEKALKTWKDNIYPNDLPRLKGVFSKEEVLDEITSRGVFETQYRLMLNDEPVKVRLRAVMMEEDGDERVLIGISRMDRR